MTTTALDIYNSALSAVSAKGRLTALDENKREAQVCTTWYGLVTKVVQEAAFWPSSKAYVALTGKTELTQPVPNGWLYSYELPADMLRPRYLQSYSTFELYYQTDAVKLLTNDPAAILVYTFLQTDVSLWTAGQAEATIYGLAAKISVPLIGDGNIAQQNFQLADMALAAAQASVLDPQVVQLAQIPSVIAARGFSGSETSGKFIYPYGSTFLNGL